MNNNYYNVNPYINDNYKKISFMEEVLELSNKLKVKIHMSFPNSEEYRDKVFIGIIESTGKDYIILSDPSNGYNYLLPLIYLDYIEFEENIMESIKQ